MLLSDLCMHAHFHVHLFPIEIILFEKPFRPGALRPEMCQWWWWGGGEAETIELPELDQSGSDGPGTVPTPPRTKEQNLVEWKAGEYKVQE